MNKPPVDVPSLGRRRDRVKTALAAYGAARDELAIAIAAESEALGAAEVPADIAAIIALVAHEFGLPETAFITAARPAHIAQPRCLAMALCTECTAHSLSEIGAAFGGRNHVTVMHARTVVASRRATEPAFAARWQRLRLNIAGRPSLEAAS